MGNTHTWCRQRSTSTMDTGRKQTDREELASLVPNGSTYSPRLVFAKAGRQKRKNKEEIPGVRLGSSE